MLSFESILDAPKETLDGDVWAKTAEGVFVLTDAAKLAIGTLVDFVTQRFGLKMPSVRITGSITSNQYSKDSDIDVHISFDGLTEENQEDFNRILRAEFKENFKDIHTDLSMIGGHPLEVYFQANPYQDLMSVGCYDFVQEMWLVGPDFRPLDFDPYSEFYSEDMKYVKDVIRDIRSVIMECYESAVVIVNSSNEDFRNEEFGGLVSRLERGVKIFEAAKQCRKVFSSPKSVEDALRMRDSRKWKVADSAFKLMDKFGYLRILKNFSKMKENIDGYSATDAAECVMSVVGASMNVEQAVDESMGSLVKSMLIAAILSFGGILSQDALAKELSKIPPN